MVDLPTDMGGEGEQGWCGLCTRPRLRLPRLRDGREEERYSLLDHDGCLGM